MITLRPKNVYKDPDDGRQRFLLELEFVQCLANQTYIHCMHIPFHEIIWWDIHELDYVIYNVTGPWNGHADLVQNRYFEDEAFIITWNTFNTGSDLST